MHEVRATIHFELEQISIPSDAVIESATLSIYRTREPKANLSYGYDQDGTLICNTSSVKWSENNSGFRELFPQIQYAHNNDGDMVAYTKNTIDWINFNVTEEIEQMLGDPASNKGFIIRGDVASFVTPGKSGLLGAYASAENSDPSLRPKLEITYNSDGTALSPNSTVINSGISVVHRNGLFNVTVPSGGEYRMQVHSVDGRLLLDQIRDLTAGSNAVEPGSETIAQRVVLFSLTNETNHFVQRIIVR